MSKNVCATLAAPVLVGREIISTTALVVTKLVAVALPPISYVNWVVVGIDVTSAEMLARALSVPVARVTLIESPTKRPCAAAVLTVSVASPITSTLLAIPPAAI